MSSLKSIQPGGLLWATASPGVRWSLSITLVTATDLYSVDTCSICDFTTPTHLPLSIKPRELLPIFSGDKYIYTGAFCVEKSLIDGSVKGQYATQIIIIDKFKSAVKNDCPVENINGNDYD